MNVTAPHRDDEVRPSATVDVWFDAGVWSAEIPIGTVTGLVCSAPSPHLHDVVVRDAERPHDEHPIAVRHITGARRRDLLLDVAPTRAHARRIPTETVMVTDGPTWWMEPDVGGTTDRLLYSESLQIPVVVPRLPSGDVLVLAHAAVYVGGHHVGRLSGVRADTATEEITAAIVDVGHHWHHRQVLVPASDVEELCDTIVGLRGSRQRIRHMPAPADHGLDDDLTPVEPRDVGVDERDSDPAHAEAAHLLADEAHDLLRERGFTDEEIRHWADAFGAEQGSGDVTGFLEWIDGIEHAACEGTAPGDDAVGHVAGRWSR